MKYFFSLVLMFFVTSTQASEVDDKIIAQVNKIAELVGDAYARVYSPTIKVKKLTSSDVYGSRVTLVSFYMEGFNQGKVSTQFIVFLRGKAKRGDYDEDYSRHKDNVTGIFAFYGGGYNIESATYDERVITIEPETPDEFYKKLTFSRGYGWWSLKE